MLYFISLQVRCIKLHIANFFQDDLLNLVAVLLRLILALLNRLVSALQAVLSLTHFSQVLLLALVADLPGLFLIVLGVTVLLRLLWSSLHFKLANLLWLKVTVLLFHGEGEDVREFLTIPMHVGFAHFNLDLARNVVAILSWLPITDNTLWTIPIVFGRLVPLAVEFDGVSAGDIVNNFLFHITIGCLDIGTLVIILGRHVDFIGGIADPVLTSETSLDLVSLLQSLVVNGFDQITHQFVYIKADTLDICLNDPSTVIVRLRFAFLAILSPTSSFGVVFTLILEHNLLDHVAIGILVNAISTNIRLAYVRIVFLGRSGCGILRWRRQRKRQGNKNSDARELKHVDHSHT